MHKILVAALVAAGGGLVAAPPPAIAAPLAAHGPVSVTLSGERYVGGDEGQLDLADDAPGTDLKLPADKKLERGGKQLALVDIPPAHDVAPDALLRAVTLEVIAVLRRDADVQAGSPAKVAELVETRILPHFDFDRMTRIAVARNWRIATPEQQAALTAEFKTLLVRTYSTALASYRDQVIEYKPLRAAPGATEVTVKSEIKQPGAERMTIDYDMEKTPAGWKVYDIKVAGISLVSTYRETFASRVRDGGIAGLIKALADKNRQGASRTD